MAGVNTRKCCCCPWDCVGDCSPGTIPQNFAMTLSGIDATTWLNTVITCGGDTIEITFVSSDGNATRNLSGLLAPSACLWGAGQSGHLVQLVYNTFYGLLAPATIVWDLTKIAGGWDFEVFTQINNIGFSSEADPRLVFFKQQIIVGSPTTCNQILTPSNGITAGTCTKVGRLLTLYFGDGGTAVMTPDC
jgi:hypothetical protein